MDTDIEKLLELIHTIVHNSSKPYAEKAASILAACDPDQRNDLEEFLSWFTDEEG